MLRYILRRLLLALPTLLLISLVTFGLSKCAPKDQDLEYEEGGAGSAYAQEAQILLKAKQLNLDKPAFYFSLGSAALPDTMHRIFPLRRRERLATMAVRTGNWPAISRFEAAARALWTSARALPDTLPETTALRAAAAHLLEVDRPDTLDQFLNRMAGISQNRREFTPLLDTARHYAQLTGIRQAAVTTWMPALHWHGLDNQYHRWLSGFVTGDLGTTRDRQKNVGAEIRPALISSLIINALAYLLAYLIAVPLGVAMARNRGGYTDHWSRRALLFLYAMPVFWLGGLLILLFATPGMGFQLINGINIRPLQGSGKTVWAWFWSNGPKFILPVLTLTLHALAVLALQMRGGILDVIDQDYIRTARAKGADEALVYWRHAFRNALFPMITTFAGLFPVVFSGSLVLENIFKYPGMGLLTYNAFTNYDYPLLFAILMLASALTILGSLVGDMLYAWADPRVRFN